MSNAPNGNTATGFVIPKWALWVYGAGQAVVVSIILPWATWTTNNIHGHSIRLTVLEETRFTANDARAANVGLETRLDRMEAKIDALQREFDRSLVRPKEGQ